MALTDFRTLGHSGLRVSPLSLGALTFGDGSWGADDEVSIAIIDRYREVGGNFIDTANIYNGGRSEEVIGSYLGRHDGERDRLVIATKFAGNMFPGDPNGGGACRKSIMQQLHASLRRLGTDYIDLYWQHNFDQHTPLDETLQTLVDLVQSGKIRYFGLSDTPAWAVSRLATIAELRGWPRVTAIQVEYSLLERTVENELFGAARALGLGVTPWAPLSGGLLTGKYSRTNTAPAGSGRSSSTEGRLTEQTFRVIDSLSVIADELGTSVAATALAWVRQNDTVTSTIIGARTVDQLDSNLASLSVTLTAGQIAKLNDLTKPQLDFPADFLRTMAARMQQAGTTVNGVTSTRFPR